MKKLTLQRETLRRLNHVDLGAIHGGNVSAGTIIIRQTVACPIPTVNGCTTGPCVETITSGGTSVINPSGG